MQMDIKLKDTCMQVSLVLYPLAAASSALEAAANTMSKHVKLEYHWHYHDMILSVVLTLVYSHCSTRSGKVVVMTMVI